MGNLRRIVEKGCTTDSRCGATPGCQQDIQTQAGRRTQTHLRGSGLFFRHRLCTPDRHHLERLASGEIRRAGQFGLARTLPRMGESRSFRGHVEEGAGRIRRTGRHRLEMAIGGRDHAKGAACLGIRRTQSHGSGEKWGAKGTPSSTGVGSRCPYSSPGRTSLIAPSWRCCWRTRSSNSPGRGRKKKTFVSMRATVERDLSRKSTDIAPSSNPEKKNGMERENAKEATRPVDGSWRRAIHGSIGFGNWYRDTRKQTCPSWGFCIWLPPSSRSGKS